MTSPSSTAVGKNKKPPGFLKVLIVCLASISLLILVFWGFKASQEDPYIKEILLLEGSKEKGNQLFRINCAGCHGIAAQGLVGPNLRGVSFRRSDSQLIHQVIEGRTPPMPSFKIEAQEMADLLAHMHSLN